jgi:Na+/H+-translocating membrane pyrophosphatase
MHENKYAMQITSGLGVLPQASFRPVFIIIIIVLFIYFFSGLTFLGLVSKTFFSRAW